MSEMMPSQPSPEEQEENEMLEQWLKDHPEPAPPAEGLRDAAKEINWLEKQVAAFETTHSLEALNAITDLTAAEAPNHPIREPARKDLFSINDRLNLLKSKTNISEAEYERLLAEYKRLSRAVGMINNGKVDHTR